MLNYDTSRLDTLCHIMHVAWYYIMLNYDTSRLDTLSLIVTSWMSGAYDMSHTIHFATVFSKKKNLWKKYQKLFIFKKDIKFIVKCKKLFK
jgi:hypothetical protein